jgi:hypothetical protein
VVVAPQVQRLVEFLNSRRRADSPALEVEVVNQAVDDLQGCVRGVVLMTGYQHCHHKPHNRDVSIIMAFTTTIMTRPPPPVNVWHRHTPLVVLFGRYVRAVTGRSRGMIQTVTTHIPLPSHSGRQEWLTVACDKARQA